MTFLIRYRDADHNLTKTVVTAEDSIDALVKFKAEPMEIMTLSMQLPKILNQDASPDSS